MNLLFVISCAHLGGVERLALMLGRALRKTCHIEIVIIDRAGPLIPEYQAAFHAVHVTWPHYIRQKQSGVQPDYHELPGLLRAQIERADVIHCFNHFMATAALAKQHASKIVQAIHFHPDAMPEQWKVNLAALEPRVRAIVTDSRLHESYLQSPVYIPNFVDTDYWRPAGNHRAGVLWVGKFTQAKGPNLLLDIASQLDRPLTAVNGVPDLPASASYTTELTAMGARVLAPQSEAEMRRLYQSHEHLLITSKHEGMPISLLEGMACGICSIATPVGAIPDVIKHGRNGYLYETPEEACGCIRNHALGKQARRTACQSFSQIRAIAKYREVYHG